MKNTLNAMLSVTKSQTEQHFGNGKKTKKKTSSEQKETSSRARLSGALCLIALRTLPHFRRPLTQTLICSDPLPPAPCSHYFKTLQ